ncbi:MAG TPA: gliding motility-associated C-terminal domain-containing protein, partial [Chitinophagaceae bacterium]|nr:gliding motility-associated C-terminal domain-containing protein [Chitinophagaceae bacterium]
YGMNPITYYMNGNSVGIDTFYNNLGPGNYIVEVKDGLGCKSTGKFVVQPSDRRPYIIIDSIHGVLCAGDKDGAIDWHAINTFPPYYYTFDSLYLGTTSFINGITNGIYSIHVIDSIGCKADTTVTIEEGDKLDLNIIASPALCQGLGDDGKAQAIVIGGVEPFQYVWSGSLGNNTNSAINLLYGNQVAYVKDGLGCIDSAQFEIEYDPCCVVNLPNAFSPNGDGVNDIYRIIKFGYITLVSFEIYNRWGNRVFSTSTENNGWDGKYQGEYADLGTYYYLLRYKCHLKNETIMQKGDVTLIR